MTNDSDGLQAGRCFAFLVVAQRLNWRTPNILYSSCKYVYHKFKISQAI